MLTDEVANDVDKYIKKNQLEHGACYDWMSSEEGETSETGRSAELAFVQRDWS